MRESYELGETLDTKDEQNEIVKTWGLPYQYLYKHNTGLPFFLLGEKRNLCSILDLYEILKESEGPVYAAYQVPLTTKGHIILVTGVDVENDIVYTNNPWYVYGKQSFQEFLSGFEPGNFRYDYSFKFRGIYIPFS